MVLVQVRPVLKNKLIEIVVDKRRKGSERKGSLRQAQIIHKLYIWLESKKEEYRSQTIWTLLMSG